MHKLESMVEVVFHSQRYPHLPYIRLGWEVDEVDLRYLLMIITESRRRHENLYELLARISLAKNLTALRRRVALPESRDSLDSCFF